jgi:hypothetical protein
MEVGWKSPQYLYHLKAQTEEPSWVYAHLFHVSIILAAFPQAAPSIRTYWGKGFISFINNQSPITFLHFFKAGRGVGGWD